MIPAPVRQEQMLAFLEGREYTPVQELSSIFGVSEVTVRSDLAALADRGQIRRVRGGALRGAVPLKELAFEETREAFADEKRAIGAAAAKRIESGDAVLLDVGTTTTAVARALRARTELRDVSVFTNALNIALELESAIPPLTVVVTGGTLRPLQHSLVDPLAESVLDHVHVDTVFLGCNGIDPEGGVTNVNLPEAQLKRRMLRVARRRIVVADGSKVGEIALARLCDVHEVDLLITGRSASGKLLTAFRKRGVEVEVAR